MKTDSEAFSWFQVPEDIKNLLVLAAKSWENTAESERYMQLAFAYAASGLVLAKLGEIEQAKEISARVKEVDDKKEFGGGLILDILTRPPEEDEE